MLESVYKKSAKFIESCIAVFITILKILVRSKFGLKLPQTDKNECAILGNGPSLKISLEKDIDFLKRTELFCVNNFIQAEEFELLRPTNYVILDNYYFVFDGKTHNPPIIRETFEKFKTVSWRIRVYVPYLGKNSYFVKNLQQANSNIEFCYFNYVITKGFSWFRHFIFRNNLGVMQCENVLGASLFVAINSGYKRVFLFGADHSWHEEYKVENNRVMINDYHFYDKDPVKPLLMHDHVKNRKITIADLFLSLHKAFRSYLVIRDYADTRGCLILNASAKSYIDSFERVEIGKTA